MTAYEAFRQKWDDWVLLGILSATEEGIDQEEFFERELDDAYARLAERDLIERDEDGVS